MWVVLERDHSGNAKIGPAGALDIAEGTKALKDRAEFAFSFSEYGVALRAESPKRRPGQARQSAVTSIQKVNLLAGRGFSDEMFHVKRGMQLIEVHRKTDDIGSGGRQIGNHVFGE